MAFLVSVSVMVSCKVSGINMMLFSFLSIFVFIIKVWVAPVDEENTNAEHELVSRNCTVGAANLEL